MMTRPVPRAEGPTAPYWDALRRREFQLPYDARHDRFLHPIESFETAGLDWRPAPRSGTVESYSWVHLPAEGYDQVPYVLATVAIDNGPQLMCNITDSEPSAVSVGARVCLVFEERTDGWVVPQFSIDTQETP